MNSPETPLPSPGCCYLVGAGPGGPELLTVKALKLIQAATLLLVDDLVSPEIVALASPAARVIQVGKRGGRESSSQAFIEKLMVMAAGQGEVVVWLKGGGEPVTFDRDGEEAERLKAAGVPVHVVSGITSERVSAAPLMHSHHAHGAIFIAGKVRPDDATPGRTRPGLVAYRGAPCEIETRCAGFA